MAGQLEQTTCCGLCALPLSAHTGDDCPQSLGELHGGEPTKVEMTHADAPVQVAALKQSNGQAVASLVFGILSLLFCWLGLLGVAMVILAVVFGLLGMLRARLGFCVGREVAISGVVLGTAGLGLYLYFGVAALGLGFRV